MKKILVTCPQEFVGVSSVFKHFVSLGLGKFVPTQQLTPELIKQADFLLLGAWHPSYNDLIKLPIKKGILLTSSILQIELTPNMIELQYLNYILSLLKEDKINYLFCGSPNLYEAIKLFETQKEENIYYFPYPYNTHLFYEYVGNNKILHSCGMFFPTHSRKNVLNQLFAFRLANLVKGELSLHTNTKLQIKGNVFYYIWLNDDAYYDLLSKIYLNLHVTVAESWCYAVADSIYLGTLPLVSPVVAKNLNLPEELVVVNIDSTIDIADRILKIMKMSNIEYSTLLYRSRESIDKLTSKNNKELAKLLSSLK